MRIQDYLNRFKQNSVNLVGPKQWPSHELLEPILYVDGGSRYQLSSEGFSLGDNDSSNHPLDHQLPTDKDYSDLAYALRHCHNFKTLNLFGFLGGRKDHEIMNFGELHSFLQGQKFTQAHFENQVSAFSQGRWPIEFSGIFSLFCFEKAHVSLIGKVKYQLHQAPLKPFSSQGLSNIAQGPFILECDKPVFAFFNEAVS